MTGLTNRVLKAKKRIEVFDLKRECDIMERKEKLLF